MKPAALLSSLLLVLIALAHLVRLVFGLAIVVDDYVVPLWPSMLAVVVAGGLATGLWRERQQTPS